MAKTLPVCMALSLFLAGFARAQLKASHFPADTSWALHLDLKSLNASPLGLLLKQSFDGTVLQRLASLKAASGIDLEKDIDALVLCGKSSSATGGILYVYGRFDTAKVTALAGKANQFQNRAFGDRSLLSWAEKGRRTNLCFIDPTLAVMSQSEQAVREAVALIDGDGKGLAGDPSFAKMLDPKKGRFLAAQANDLAGLAGANPQLQLIKQAEAALLEIGQADSAGGLDCSLVLKTANAQTAQQMSQAAAGLQALAMLQATQRPEVADFAQNLRINLEDAYVTVQSKLPEELIRKQLEKRAEQRRAAQANRQAARAAKAEAEAGKQPARPEFKPDEP